MAELGFASSKTEQTISATTNTLLASKIFLPITTSAPENLADFLTGGSPSTILPSGSLNVLYNYYGTSPTTSLTPISGDQTMLASTVTSSTGGDTSNDSYLYIALTNPGVYMLSLNGVSNISSGTTIPVVARSLFGSVASTAVTVPTRTNTITVPSAEPVFLVWNELFLLSDGTPKVLDSGGTIQADDILNVSILITKLS